MYKITNNGSTLILILLIEPTQKHPHKIQIQLLQAVWRKKYMAQVNFTL